MASLINGEFDATVQARAHTFVAPPVIHHAFASLGGHSPAEDAASLVAHIDSSMVFADS